MSRRWSLLLAALALGCDASYGAFLDSVPIPDQRGAGAAPLDVYLAIDGLSREGYDRARAAGAFADFADGDLVTPFPGTSDYSWTRVLGAGSLPGYEIQYFDPARNRLVNDGLRGVVEHPIREGLAGSFPCYQRFDFLGDGYLWMARGYQDPEAALPPSLDELFAVLVRRARQPSPRRVFLGYLLNVDVIGHKGGLDRAVLALREIDRRIQRFQAAHPGQFRFTLFGDHGNAHLPARLVDPRQLLRESAVTPVDALPDDDGQVAAVPVVHVRVTYVALHTRPAVAAAVAERMSRHRDVELAVAALEPGRYGIWRQGEAFRFSRTNGGWLIEQPARWRVLGLELGDLLAGDPQAQQALLLDDAEAFARTARGRYPDLLHRAATAFTHPAARNPASVILSLPDDVASYGFHVPGSGDGVAVDGFHGGLSRGGSVSVLASQAFTPAPVVRADDLSTLLPGLRRD